MTIHQYIVDYSSESDSFRDFIHRDGLLLLLCTRNMAYHNRRMQHRRLASVDSLQNEKNKKQQAEGSRSISFLCMDKGVGLFRCG